MKNYKERDSYPMSYQQSKNYAEPGMFTDEQLKRITLEAERCDKCPYPDDCHVCPWDIIEDEPERVEELKRYHAEGMPDRAIAGRMRMTSKTVKALREVLGLKDNGPYQVWYARNFRKRVRDLANDDNKAALGNRAAE